MDQIHDFLIRPFAEYAFMRRGLVACLALCLSAGPLGVFLVLRRMSLMGDVMAHAILPGVAVGFLVSGLSIWAMSLGGLAAGLIVALLAGATARLGVLREDATLAAFYLISLALGVVLVSLKGGAIDIVHILFGSLLSVDAEALQFLGAVAALTVIGILVLYRPLLLESFDPVYLKSVGGAGWIAHLGFLALTVLNLVAGMQALGTLLSIGLIILPAASARLWARSIGRMMALASLLAFASSAIGILLSFHADLPAGPAVVLSAGLVYFLSLAIGTQGGALRRLAPAPHLEH